ncbi:hypothetical protein [Haliangium sp.]|uniref:hypothetical protein n=1 Tax=Haliangium sp. TaxID=2663208 RepID=UPI003D14DE81
MGMKQRLPVPLRPRDISPPPLPRAPAFNGVVVFSNERTGGLGHVLDRIQRWIDAHEHCDLHDLVVTQSERGRTVMVSLFYWDETLEPAD